MKVAVVDGEGVRLALIPDRTLDTATDQRSDSAVEEVSRSPRARIRTRSRFRRRGLVLRLCLIGQFCQLSICRAYTSFARCGVQVFIVVLLPDFSGLSFTRHSLLSSAFTDFVCPAIAKLASSPAAAQPQTRTAASAWRFMRSGHVAGSDTSACAAAARRSVIKKRCAYMVGRADGWTKKPAPRFLTSFQLVVEKP